MKPYAPACEKNKGPILDVLCRVFDDADDVLEIGSGTGQHAVWFAAGLPHLVWRPSDLPYCHAGIDAWIDEAGLDNVKRPLALDVTRRPWPIERAGGVFSANTAHFMHWSEVEAMFQGVAEVLPPGARFALYGPFARNGRHTSASNAAFRSLVARIRSGDGGEGPRRSRAHRDGWRVGARGGRRDAVQQPHPRVAKGREPIMLDHVRQPEEERRFREDGRTREPGDR